MIYNGQNRGKLFDSNGWGNFVKDNNLKLGDACVFELMEHSKDKIVFQVQILRGNPRSNYLELVRVEKSLFSYPNFLELVRGMHPLSLTS
jgi:hypothetical protein